MAGIKQPILDIMALLETIDVRNNDGQTVKLRARVFNNQIEREKNGTQSAFQKPAAFVEILNGITWEELGQGYQSADVGFRIRLVHEQYDAGDGTMDQNLDVFDLRDEVVKTISLFEPTGCGPLTKTSEFQDYDHTNIYVYILEFACNFTESVGSLWDKGKLVDKLPPTDLEIDLYIETHLSQVINYTVTQPEKADSDQYTASADGETQVFFNKAIGGTFVMAIKEVKPLLISQFNWDPVNGFLTLLGGVTLDKGQTLFFIFSKPI